MYAHQRRQLAADGSKGQRHVYIALNRVAVSDQIEAAQLTVQLLLTDPLHGALMD